VPEHIDHVSADDLALRALGEELTDVPEAHLAGCSHCQSELDQLRAVVTTARAVEPEDYPSAPPASVWDGIAAELGLGQSGVDGGSTGASDASAASVASAASGGPVGSEGAGVVPLSAARRGRDGEDIAGGAGGVDSADGAPGRGRRPAAWLLTAAAAVVGLVVGIGVTLVATSGDDDELPVVASTELVVLADDSPGGDAEIRGSGSTRVLELDVPGLSPDADGFYEVWLLDEDAKRLVSIGLLDPSQGTQATFPIPEDLDVAEFPVVDVSVEPADGDPAHSGDSIVRGTLTT